GRDLTSHQALSGRGGAHPRAGYPVAVLKAVLCGALMLLAGCITIAVQPTSAVEGVPSDPAATSSAKAVLAYLAALSKDTIPGVIAGQNIGHSADFDAWKQPSGYSTVIDGLEAVSGEVPGM